jgi:hypothetical protein
MRRHACPTGSPAGGLGHTRDTGPARPGPCAAGYYGYSEGGGGGLGGGQFDACAHEHDAVRQAGSAVPQCGSGSRASNVSPAVAAAASALRAGAGGREWALRVRMRAAQRATAVLDEIKVRYDCLAPPPSSLCP